MSESLLFEPETTSSTRLRTHDILEGNMSAPKDSDNDGNNTTFLPSSQTSSSTQEVTTSIDTPTATTNYSSSNVTTEVYWSTSVPPHGDVGEEGTAVAIIIILVVLVVILALTCYFLKKKGKLSKLPCYTPISRTRRSSTSSSRRALEEHEVMENDLRPKPDGQADDMFAIDDFDANTDPQEGKEEYYYDEVFAQSQFEDEATSNAMRQLYSDHQNEEEMLDLDFETLGIKIEDYGLGPDRKNTV